MLTRFIFFAALAVGFADGANAQTARYIASNGDDANECTRTQPCRTLQRGINRVSARGEVQILDSATYGEAITINKAVTITANAVMATIGTVTINAPGDTVSLNGLHISGRNARINLYGVAVQAAAAVYLIDCDIEGVPNPGSGILFGGTNTRLVVSRTSVRDHAAYGLLVQTTSSNVQLVVEDSRFENNHNEGIRHLGPGGQAAIERSFFIGNGGAGLHVGNGGTARISNSVVVNNNVGLRNEASTLQSRGNNIVTGNTTNTSGAISPLGGV